jgi:hypothetical protein
MVAMMGHAARFTRVVIDHVGVGQAFDRMLAMTESEHGGRCDEAKHRNRHKCQRKPKSHTVIEADEHGPVCPSSQGELREVANEPQAWPGT